MHQLNDLKRYMERELYKINNEVVNVIFTLQDDKFNTAGKMITNVAPGNVDNDVVNMHQLDDIKRYTESELYKINNIVRYHIDRIYNKLRQSASRSLVGDENLVWTHTPALIEKYDKSTEVKDWKSVYE